MTSDLLEPTPPTNEAPDRAKDGPASAKASEDCEALAAEEGVRPESEQVAAPESWRPPAAPAPASAPVPEPAAARVPQFPYAAPQTSPYGPYPQQWSGQSHVQPGDPTFSILSFVIAGLGVMFLPFLSGLVALVFAYLARSRGEGTPARVAVWVAWILTLLPVVVVGGFFALVMFAYAVSA